MQQQAHSQQIYPNFVPYYGDCKDLVRNDDYLVFRWVRDDCLILFSVCQRGKAANTHFYCDKSGLRYLREAIGQFCDFLFWMFEWCTMVMAIIEKSSVVRTVEKVGFQHIKDIDNSKVYVKVRDGKNN